MACECLYCAIKLDFDLDDHLLDEIENRRCVIFAGAGISTETTGAHSFSFYEQIAKSVNCSGKETFPQLIDIFESRPNGRQKLIEQIKSRFEYIDGWHDLRLAATKFHRSLATAPYFSKIITTNWDRYFEDTMHATPFVYDSDLAFWENASRPLLKIHGSIDNLSTIVASSSDYKDCEQRLKNGRLGDILRHIFATHTVIFFGYSVSDPDFQSIFGTVQNSMGRLARTHYLVSPYLSDEESEKLRNNFNIFGIKTDATHFIDTIKSHMVEKYCFANDLVYDKIIEKLFELNLEHEEFVNSYSVTNEPHLIFSTSYQDGLIHCLQRIYDRRHSGDFADLHRVRAQAALYEDRIRNYTKARNYWDSSYFVGYQTGLLYFDILNADLDPKQEVSPELLDVPFYYHPKLGHLEKAEFDETVRPNPEVHKAALRQAMRFAEEFDGSTGIIPQHTPFG